VDSGSNALRPRPASSSRWGIWRAATAARSNVGTKARCLEDHTDLNQRDRSKLARRVEFIEYAAGPWIPKAAATSEEQEKGHETEQASERGTGKRIGAVTTGMGPQNAPIAATVVFRRICLVFPHMRDFVGSSPPSPEGSATTAGPGDDNRGAPGSRPTEKAV